MSEKGNQTTFKYVGVFIILLLFVALLLGSIGFIWATNDSEPGDSASAGTVTRKADTKDVIDTVPPTPVLATPRASAVAPLAPTAIATSDPQPTLLPLPTFNNPIDERLVEESLAWGADFVLVDEKNTGVRQYEAQSFIRPIAMEVSNGTCFLLDGGRVLALNLDQPEPPVELIASGDSVEGVLILEPLDLAVIDDALFVLDRAGDVYRYNIKEGIWNLDRFDRPVEASSGHYFVALDVPSIAEEDETPHLWRTLLETNYKFAMQYRGDEQSLWNLPEGRSVDVSGSDGDTFVLQREMFDLTGIINKYRDTRLIEEFSPEIEIEFPREILATETAVYVLDMDGHRLLALDPGSGILLTLYQLPQDSSVSAFTVDLEGHILLAGRDRLFLLGQPQWTGAIPGGPVLSGSQPHDPGFLAELLDYTVPIGGSNITFRDFQLPGAPRHYRLGVHQGLDFYWQPGTKILAAADGSVIRADLDYVPPTAAQLAAWWNESQQQGYTSTDTLNNYLGRQVWIQHADGLVSRYAHLRTIAPGIKAGTQVSKGQVIGEVGNSGSPASLESEKADAHLHFELWMGDKFLGQFMRPIETREWIERIFANGE